MFKEIIDSQKRTTLLYDAIQEVLGMIERAERMYELVCASLMNPQPEIVDIERDDRDINASERLVRRMVFEHLVMNPQQDLPTSLSLLSIVHDIERIGDYSKSLVELSAWSGLNSGASAHSEECQQLHRAIAPLFAQVLEALRESDIERARLVMRQHEEIKKQSNVLIEQIIKGEGQNSDAVPYALAARFLRRISAHLSNVASSVANPFDRVSGKEA
ncbi:MAG: PhoU domain-containing protein [Candidatus Latescibacterota bacterium]|jgi:phosphate transport system protein